MEMFSTILQPEVFLPWFWLALMIILSVIELLTVGLVTIWFAIGALAAWIAALMGIGFWGQLLLFLLVSVATLFGTRPLVQKHLNNRIQATNADRLIGSTCIVTEEVNNVSGTGTVSIAGNMWTARSESGQVFAVGERVTVIRIEGVKLIVGKAEC